MCIPGRSGCAAFIIILVMGPGLNHSFAQAPNKDSLLAPFRTGGNDGLNGLLLVPGMESAIALGKKTFKAELGLDYVLNDFGDTNGNSRFTMDNSVLEFSAHLSYGVADFLDIGIHVPYTSTDSIVGIIEGEALFDVTSGSNSTDPGNEMSDPVLEAKFQVWGGKQPGTGFSLRSKIKIPLADERDLHSSGGVDVSLGVLYTEESSYGVLHLNLDYIAYGSHNSFRPQANVDLTDTVLVGAAYMFEVKENQLSVGAQAYTYLNPYRDTNGNLDGLDGPPLGIMIGTRWFPWKNFGIEFSAGPGLTSDSGSFYAFLNLSYQL
ncbi:MAG: transporter [Planctomycetota bacterium]|jgi:hypothetical protein|nr:transporter [Planctomycetota bacterium]